MLLLKCGAGDLEENLKNIDDEELNKSILQFIGVCMVPNGIEIIISPDGFCIPHPYEYKVTKNGTYTFKVRDIISGKTYEKTVEVDNVDESIPYYVETYYNDGRKIGLFDRNTKNVTTCSEAYIIYNNEKIDISSLILDNDSFYTDNLAYKLEDDGVITDAESELYNKDFMFIFIKDGVEYEGMINVRRR